MTKEEWQNSTNTIAMLRFAKLSKRKERLFACNCARHIWHLLKDERSRKAVKVAELYADGKATKEELEQAREELEQTRQYASYAAYYASYAASYNAAAAAYYAAAAAYYAAVSASHTAEHKWQANLLRHMVKIHD